jgi:hypothetical protein
LNFNKFNWAEGWAGRALNTSTAASPHVGRHSKMKMFKLLTLFFITFIGNSTSAQRTDTFSLSGKAVSKYSDKPIRGASIIIDKNTATTSDTAGRFSIWNLEKGKYKLSVRSLGLDRKDTVIILDDKNIRDLVLSVSTDCKYYNRKTAIKDIKHKKATLFVESQPNLETNKLFQTKYGIQLQYKDFEGATEDCMTIYNNTIIDHLNKTFGKEWRDVLKVNLIGLR